MAKNHWMYCFRHTSPCPLPHSATASSDIPQYFGLHPFVFKNSASKAFGYLQTAHKLISTFGSSSAASSVTASKAPVAAILPPPSAASSASWAKWAKPAAIGLGGLLVSGATAGAAYYTRDDLGLGYKWATDHMKFVGNLWDEKQMKGRVKLLFEIEESQGVVFRVSVSYPLS